MKCVLFTRKTCYFPGTGTANVQPALQISGSQKLSVALCDSLWLSVALCGSLRLSATLCSSLQLSAAIGRRMYYYG